MIDQIVKLVQQHAGPDLAAIPGQQKDEAAKLIGSEILGGLQTQAQQGNIAGLTSLLKIDGSSLASNPIVTNIISSIADKLAAKFGLPRQTTQQIASAVIPKVLNQFISKTNDPKDNEFELQDVMKNIGGNALSSVFSSGGKGGIGDAIGGFFS